MASRSIPLVINSEASIATVAPAIMALSTSRAVWTPPVAARSADDPAVEDRDPAQRQAQVVRVAQRQARHNLQHLQVQVRLVEAVEQHQAVGAGLDEAPSDIGQRS